MGWLRDLTEWLLRIVREVWGELMEFFEDAILTVIEAWLAMVIMQWSHIPVPDFLDGYTLCNLLSSAGPTVGWAMTTFRVGEALGLIAAGYVFRLIRKFATLFQW